VGWVERSTGAGVGGGAGVVMPWWHPHPRMREAEGAVVGLAALPTVERGEVVGRYAVRGLKLGRVLVRGIRQSQLHAAMLAAGLG
jgi:hypothetical protein